MIILDRPPGRRRTPRRVEGAADRGRPGADARL